MARQIPYDVGKRITLADLTTALANYRAALAALGIELDYCELIPGSLTAGYPYRIDQHPTIGPDLLGDTKREAIQTLYNRALIVADTLAALERPDHG